MKLYRQIAIDSMIDKLTYFDNNSYLIKCIDELDDELALLLNLIFQFIINT